MFIVPGVGSHESYGLDLSYNPRGSGWGVTIVHRFDAGSFSLFGFHSSDKSSSPL